MLQCYFELDYMNREDYVDFVIDINNIVPSNGLVNHYVSNAPGHLASIIYVECDEKYQEQIEKIAENHNVPISFDKTLEHFMKEMISRKWNCFQFFPNMNPEDIKALFLTQFEFVSNRQLKQKGYHFEHTEYKPKVFISYSWNDQELVNSIVDQLNIIGINIWIDRKAIDYGDHILESIQNGINDCDMALCFISNSYKKSSMGKHELRTIWSNFINKEKRWMIIKIDDVNPEEIYPGLNQFKYFDLNTEKQGDLILSISKSVNKIKTEKKMYY